MAFGQIHAGYLGYAIVGGSTLRCSDFNVNPRQDMLFYDHTRGLRDSAYGGLFSGKSDASAHNAQKVLGRPSVKIHQGSITYYLTERGGDPLYKMAANGDEFNMAFKYTCGVGRVFTYCRVNSYTFTATAGDIVTINAEIICRNCSDSGIDSIYSTMEKLVTWDAVQVSGPADLPMQSVSFTINNNCIPIYTAGGNKSLNLNPVKIRVGMQDVNGSIGYYNKGIGLHFLDAASRSVLGISAPGFSAQLNVIYKPEERTASVSPVISSLPFVGVDVAAM